MQEDLSKLFQRIFREEAILRTAEGLASDVVKSLLEGDEFEWLREKLFVFARAEIARVAEDNVVQESVGALGKGALWSAVWPFMGSEKDKTKMEKKEKEMKKERKKKKSADGGSDSAGGESADAVILPAVVMNVEELVEEEGEDDAETEIDDAIERIKMESDTLEGGEMEREILDPILRSQEQKGHMIIIDQHEQQEERNEDVLVVNVVEGEKEKWDERVMRVEEDESQRGGPDGGEEQLEEVSELSEEQQEEE